MNESGISLSEHPQPRPRTPEEMSALRKSRDRVLQSLTETIKSIQAYWMTHGVKEPETVEEVLETGQFIKQVSEKGGHIDHFLNTLREQSGA
jgi:hypothetical protein